MKESEKKRSYKATTVITVLFVVLVTFVGPNSLWKTFRLQRDIKRIKKERSIVRASAAADSTFIENLKDDEFLEKFARENFYMKRKGEEIYVIEDEKTDRP